MGKDKSYYALQNWIYARNGNVCYYFLFYLTQYFHSFTLLPQASLVFASAVFVLTPYTDRQHFNAKHCLKVF